MLMGGLIFLILGAECLVRGASRLAGFLGVSPLVIGLTVVAFGTSSPELAVSVKSALSDQAGLALGNVVGSNIFNILGVLGITGLVAPSPIEVSAAALHFDIPVMIAVSLACMPIFFSGGRISRWEGGLLLGYEAAYTLYLVLAASHHDALPGFSAAMLYFVLPLTVVTLTAVTFAETRRR